MTDQRIVAFGAGKRQLVNLPFTDERVPQVNFSVKNDRVLSIQNDASLFQPTWSGSWEIRFVTDQAQELYERIQESIKRATPTR